MGCSLRSDLQHPHAVAETLRKSTLKLYKIIILQIIINIWELLRIFENFFFCLWVWRQIEPNPYSVLSGNALRKIARPCCPVSQRNCVNRVGGWQDGAEPQCDSGQGSSSFSCVLVHLTFYLQSEFYRQLWEDPCSQQQKNSLVANTTTLKIFNKAIEMNLWVLRQMQWTSSMHLNIQTDKNKTM